MKPEERKKLEALRDRWRAWKVREIGENARDAFLDCADAIDALLRESEDSPDSSPEQEEALNWLKTTAEITDEIELSVGESFALAEALHGIRSYIQRVVPNSQPPTSGAGIGNSRAVPVPEGWQLVPVELTDAMAKQADSNWSGFCADGVYAPRRAARRLYRAMLKAAPRAGDKS